jgi:hypothetical protein
VAEGRDGFARKKKEKKLTRRGRLPCLEFLFLTGLPQGLFFLSNSLLSSFAGVMPRALGLGGGSDRQKNRRPSASSCWPNCGGAFPTVPKSSSPCCSESRASPAHRSNFDQVGSGHEQCTVRRGRIIPWHTSKSLLFHQPLLDCMLPLSI